MKNALLLVMLTLIGLGISSCKKDNTTPTSVENNNGNGETEDFYFKVNIDGQEFSADMKSCGCSTPASFGTEAYTHSGVLAIRAMKDTTNADAGYFFLGIGTVSDHYNGPGTYELVGGQGNYASVEYNLGSGMWAAGDKIVDVNNGQAVYSTGTGSVTSLPTATTSLKEHSKWMVSAMPMVQPNISRPARSI